MGGKSSQSTQTVSIPPEVLARYNAVNARAETAANTPFQQYSNDPNAFVAQLSPTQQAGIASTNAAAGMAQPYYGAATNYAVQGGQAVNPGQLNVGQYLNPYIGGVVGSAAALLNQQQQAQMSGQTGQAIQQGAFGGDRAGIAAANLAGQQQLAFANAINPLLSQGYNTAMQTAQQQQGVELGAEQANRQALQQTGQSLAGLGAGAQTAALQGAQAQLAAGQAQQQTEQAGKTALYNQFLQQQSYPYQQAQFLANIAEGTGALSGSTTTGSSTISDSRAKHDKRLIGRTFDGQPIYSFKYNGDDRTQIGLMAQEVEHHHPEAVGLAGGLKTVDYGKATDEAARRGHFARGGLAGNSEGGVVHYGHMGEGYAIGGMIEPMGYGNSPFVGYDPAAAYQSLYGGLLGHHAGIGGEDGIPTGGASHGSLAVANMKMPEMPNAGADAKNMADAATSLYGLGKQVGAWGKGAAPVKAGSMSDAKSAVDSAMNPIIDRNNQQLSSDAALPKTGGSDDYAPSLSDFGERRGGRIGLGTGGIPYGAAAEDIIPDEKPGAEKLMQADPSSLPKPGGGGVSGALGAAGSLASLVPGGQLIGAGLGAASKIGGLFGFAEGGEVDDGSDEADNNIGLGEKPVEVKGEEGSAERNIPMEAPKIEPLKGQTLNMAKPKTFLDQLQQATGIAANMAGMAGAKRGGAIGYADGGDVDDPVDSSVLQSILRQLSGVDQEKFLDEIRGNDTPIEETPPMGLAARGAGAPGPAPDVSGLGGGFREKIMKGEGTDKFSSPYDVVYGANPRTGLSPYANPRDHLSSMPMGDVQDFQRQLIGATRGKVRGLGPDVGTGAVGAYQFTRDTLANIAQKLYGPDWKSIPFSPKVQDELASELASERHGHLAGTWAAFRDQGPEGRLLRAQAGYAFGGVAGRNGYDDGGSIKTDENGYLVDPSAEPSSEGFGDEGYTPSGTMGEKEMSSSPYGDGLIDSAMSQIRSVAPNEEGYPSIEQMGSQAESDLAKRAPSEKDRLSDLRGEPRDRGVLGNVLHGKFISGLGKGEADSWLPLLAGIGASMSGPYRGIVGLGQGLAAGAKTAQGIRQYELGSELGRGQLGVAQQQAATNRLHVLVDAVPQFMSRFKDAGNGYFYDPTGHFSGNGPVGANGKKMLSAAEMDSLRGNFIDQIARNYNMDPDQISSAAGLNAAGGLGGSGPAAPVAPTPSGGATEAVNHAGTPTVTPHRPVRAAATPASPQDWRNPQSYATSAEYTPMPAKTPGAVYTMETDPDALQRRANAGDPTAQNLLAQYRAGRFAPIVAATQRPDDAYTRWASGLTTQKANVETDRNSAVAFRNGASNYKTERDAIVAPTNQVLQAGKAQDVGYGGRGLTYQISHGLLPYGLVGGETAKITNDAEAARAMAQGAANLAHKYGIPFTAPNIAFGGNTSGALYYGIMMERAAANAAHHKADTFYHHDTALSGAGGLGQMSKFNRDWAANNPITSFLGQDVSRNGFIKGMTNQEKAQYVQFLPSVPRTGTPRDGLYQFKGGLVEYHNGQAYPGGMPGSRLIAN